MICPNPLVIALEYLSSWRKFWFQDRFAFVWLVLSIPIMISFHSIVHEGTHGLITCFKTGDFPKIIPFLMEYDGTFQNGMTVPAVGWSGWPQIVAVLIMVGLALLFCIVNFRSPIVGLLLKAWFVAAAGDFIANTFLILSGTHNAGKDWEDARLDAGWGTTSWWILTAFLWLVPVSHFVWICWSKWWDEPLPHRPFWGYRWAALVLGILASISLLFYLFVRDPDIGYTSAPYLIGLFMQIAAWGFYWVYFVLTITRHEPQENSPAV